MKRIILLLLLIGSTTINICAQSNEDIERIKSRIFGRDTTLVEIKKKDILIDTLNHQVEDCKKLINLMENELCKKDKKISYQELLLSPDTIVFYAPLDSMTNIPICVLQHTQLLQKISVLRVEIEQTEEKVHETTEKLSGVQLDEDTQKDADAKKKAIRNSIEENMYKLDSLFTEIDTLNMSSLSDKQKAFYRPGLTERFNNLLIYFV